MIMLGSSKDDEFGRGFKSPNELGGIETRSAYIVASDADAVHARAVAAAARSCARSKTCRMAAASSL